MTAADTPPVADDVLAALRAIATPTLANALDVVGAGGIMAPEIQGVGPGLKCVGRAITVAETTGPYGSFPESDFRVGDFLDIAGPGDVIVVANGGAPVSTWGGMASYAATVRGIEGLIVDGGVRDREEILEFGFPVFSRHVVPTPGKRRLKVEAIGEPIICAGVRVAPGDVIVADGSGVVVLPAEKAAEIAALAAGYAADDARAIEDLKNGLSFRDALKKFAKI
ncbi:RraA family protein [Acuticoccus sp. I52.16.1]|uniref:RraA family protein n=1 Tax=Acuticoccus sp. I52.16.1 TaxID=2928472 RepID=UPI001FD4193C|nr:RraA family protein [Acuticoccus sp. I52.16.1]UOM34784.1 RraA family protein [Acuticoccus sp. I52.16.1]